MKIEQLKEKFLKVPSNRSKLIVKNKLSQKPQSAVNNLRQFVESQKVYNVTMFQDYSTNTVNFNLVVGCDVSHQKTVGFALKLCGFILIPY